MSIPTTNIKLDSSDQATVSASEDVVEDVPEDPIDCAICCDDFNMSTKKKVKCPYCNYCACKTCVRQYLTHYDQGTTLYELQKGLGTKLSCDTIGSFFQ